MHAVHQEREMDWNALMRAVLLMAFTAFLVRLFSRNEIGMYIHPKFQWFTITAGAGMVLMAIGQFAKAVRGTTQVGAPLRGRLYIAFAAMLAVGFLLKPHVFQADLAAKQGLNITSLASASTSSNMTAPAPAAPPVPAEPKSAATAPATVEPSKSAEATPTAPAPTTAAPVALTITNENFVRSLMTIYGNHVAWAGKRIAVDGFVFSADDLPPEEFGFAKLVVTCHVAHAAPQGFVAYNPSGQRPADDTWHRIEGVLEPTMYQGQSTLRLRIEKITPIAKPTDPYVYG